MWVAVGDPDVCGRCGVESGLKVLEGKVTGKERKVKGKEGERKGLQNERKFKAWKGKKRNFYSRLMLVSTLTVDTMW